MHYSSNLGRWLHTQPTAKTDDFKIYSKQIKKKKKIEKKNFAETLQLLIIFFSLFVFERVAEGFNSAFLRYLSFPSLSFHLNKLHEQRHLSEGCGKRIPFKNRCEAGESTVRRTLALHMALPNSIPDTSHGPSGHTMSDS